MQKIIAPFAVLFLLTATLTAQKTFLGAAEYAFTIEGENAEMMKMFMPEKMVVLYGSKSMLTYMTGGMMADAVGKIVVNGEKGETFIIKEAEKVVYLMGPEDLETPEDLQNPVVTELEGEEEIQGYTCKQYKVVAAGEDEETVQYIWSTTALQAPEIKQQGMDKLNNGMGFAGAVPGFPMKVVSEIPQTNARLILIVTSLDFNEPAASAFERPADFEVKEFDAEKMMGGGN